MLRRALLAVARSNTIKKVTTRAPIARNVVQRFVPGETGDDAVVATRQLAGAGLSVSLDHLGEDTTTRQQADAIVFAYLDLLERLGKADLTATTEVSIKLSALGQGLADGDKIALANAEQICSAARAAGMTVTVDMEDHTTTDSTLEAVSELRKEFPRHRCRATGLPLPHRRGLPRSCLRGSRVRLCKGAYAEPESVAFHDRDEIDLSYVRCLKILMAGEGYPMLATHDPRLIEIGQWLAADRGRGLDSYEFQMLYGIRPTEQRRLADLGHGCGSTCRTAATGTAIWSGAWPSAPPTWPSSPVR